MSALSLLLFQMGHEVSGSDLKTSSVLERLGAVGVAVSVGHDPSNVAGVDAVVISSAIREGNIEVLAAGEAGIPVFSRADLLAEVVSLRRSLVVAGTHGKTTTTSMLAGVLAEAGWHPSFLVGGELNETGAGAAWDDGEWLVVEGDESDGTFLRLPCELAVVTNVEPDHLEHYGGFPGLKDAFASFLERAPSSVVGVDGEVGAELAASHGSVTFGIHRPARYTAEIRSASRTTSRFELFVDGEEAGEVSLAVPGEHNVENALCAAAAALEIGVPFAAVRGGLGRFAGVARRYQFRGTRQGVTYVEDYAHLPGEVRAAIATAASGGWERVVAVFQPHRYSRTAALWSDFGPAFRDADVVILADIYAAGEPPRPGVSGRLLADAVARSCPSIPVHYVESRAELGRSVASLVREGDVCLLLGAGDVSAVADELLGEG